MWVTFELRVFWSYCRGVLVNGDTSKDEKVNHEAEVVGGQVGRGDGELEVSAELALGELEGRRSLGEVGCDSNVFVRGT